MFALPRRLTPLALPFALAALAIAPAAADGPKDNIPDNVRPVPPKGAEVAEADLKELRAGLAELRTAIDWLPHDLLKYPKLVELIPDVEIYHKAVRYAVEFGELYVDKNRNDVAAAKKLLAQGLQRVKELKEFLFANMYRHYRVVRMGDKAGRILRDLFESYVGEPLQLPPHYQERIAHDGVYRVVCDYIAGMTDRFAVDDHRKLFDPGIRV